MSLFKLIIHSFSIIAVFKYQVFLRSILILILLFFLLKSLFRNFYIFIFSLFIVIFNLIYFIVSFREKKKIY